MAVSRKANCKYSLLEMILTRFILFKKTYQQHNFQAAICAGNNLFA